MLMTLTTPYQHTDEDGRISTVGDSKLILWVWDKSRCQAMATLPWAQDSLATHASFSVVDQNSIVVTGRNMYRFYRMQENHTLKVIHQTLAKKDPLTSSAYAGHSWLPDGRLLLATEAGDVLLIESSGDFKMALSCSPGHTFRVQGIMTYSKGFILSGDHARFLVYERTEEVKNPFKNIVEMPGKTLPIAFDDTNIRRQGVFTPKLMGSVGKSPVHSMSLNVSENMMVFSTDNH